MATATLSRKGNLCEHCPTEGKILNSTEKLVSHFWRSAYNSFDLNSLARRALSFQQGTTCPQNPLVQQTNKNMLGSTHSTFLFFFFLLDPSSPTKDQTCAPPSALEAWSLNPWTAREVRGSTRSRGTSSALKTTFILCTCSVAQSCPTLCDPMDYSPQSSSVHGISQARILEWIAISYSRGSSWPRDRIQVSCTDRRIFYHWATWEALLLSQLNLLLSALTPSSPDNLPHCHLSDLPRDHSNQAISYKILHWLLLQLWESVHDWFPPTSAASTPSVVPQVFFTSTLQNQSKMLKHTFCHISLQTLFFCLVISSSSWFM